LTAHTTINPRSADEIFAETDARLHAINTALELLIASQQETAERFKETDAKFKETDVKFKETDKQVKELGKQIGGLGNKFGSFTEGLALPSVQTLLEERFGVESFTRRLRHRTNGATIEVDGFGFSNGSRNEGFVVEVKSRLDTRAVEQTLRILKEFRTMFPHFSTLKLYGIIAAADAEDQALHEAWNQGLYVVLFHNELMDVRVPDGFVPREF
jgi:hypothetical protein